ncbi:MAG: hypothetical protein R3B70_12825 [Polyangiaceae bacterium]
MSLYVVESYDFSVEHGGRDSQGVVGENKGSEKIYLHVLPLTDAELKKLAVRVDENGNKQSDRLALPGRDDFWVAVEGEVFWPKLYRPRISSHCTDLDTKPTPVPLSEEDIDRLRKSGAQGI